MQESTFSTLKSRKMKFTSATQRQFITNYYSIKVNQKKCMIYQYSYSVVPEIENDSSRKLQNIIRNIWKELINKIGLISIRGNNLYGNIDFKGQTTHLSKIKNDQGTQIIYEVLIKKVKDLPLSQMVYSSKPQESYIAMQVINIDTKERLRKMNMIQMDQGKYYAKKKIVNQNFQTGFFVLKGFSFTAQKLKIGLSLHVQIFSRLIRQRNVLQQMNQMKSKDDINAILPGSIVITRYGNFRTYKVLDVDFTKSPLSKFTPKNQNQEVTYVDYYKHNYDVNINLKNQPLLHIITKIQKVKRKGDKTEKVIHEGYLIPQLVSLVGLSDEHRRNGPLMRQIASRTQINVQKRIKQTQDQIQMLNNQQGLYSIDSVVKVDGYQLQQPMIETKRSFQAQNGQIKIEKQLVKQPAYFKNWYFIVHRNYITEARQLQKALKVSSKAFGIVIEESTVYQMDEIKAQQWRDEIEQQFKYIKEKNQPWPQIIMVLMGGALKDTVYHEIKNLFTTKLKICTQFTQVSKIVAMNKKNQLLSYASNIILQMNAKVGKPIWQVPVKNPHLAKKSLMIGAMAVSKNGNQYSLGFVGTINPKLSKVYNETKIQKKRNQFTTGALSPIFTNWLKTYFQANGRKGLADIIIFYREGLTPTQAQRNVKLEVEALEEAIKQAKNKTKLTNYNPEIVYMSVNKRSTSRFYDQLGTSTSQQKFAPKFMNPFSGSVIVDSLCGQNITNFNLASTCPNAGYTASPSEFIIHYHNPKRTPEQAFIELSFEQCFNYYNWRGAIKSPACLQNADRLAKLAGKSLKSDITPDNQLSKLHHFL